MLVTIVNVAALILTATLTPATRVTTHELLLFGILAAGAWISMELTRHIERRRVYGHKSSVAYIDTKAVWSFAAVIVLPIALAAAMVVTTYALAWWRVKNNGRPGIPFRWIYSCSTVLLGTYAAAAVLAAGMENYPGTPGSADMSGLIDLGAIALAASLRWGINYVLVLAAIAMADPTMPTRQLFTNFSEQLLDAGALGLGMVTAAVVVNNPFVIPGIVIAMVALHRGFLVHQYQLASRVDTKTGLASAGWWHEYADQMLAKSLERSETPGILIVDLDHFKSINDTYGHPFGDEALSAVAHEILAEIRDQDACGRWGGEEFVVILPNMQTESDVIAVAERVRRRIESLVLISPESADQPERVPLTVSVGAALYPIGNKISLDEFLLAADGALYSAKRGGRNRVRLAVSESQQRSALPHPHSKTEPAS
ncbi:GGDEF domain-containing protein [Phytoactinopolyspora halotolerans]|uniref:GGDEF domain-containing protein n=1 Tax=Phytoactinopolyspora halotolerans TaxID=1981512 RepID=UPI001C205231|nr:GGDEF domain-containing protein [Phytoactinopolyspora halotolerans]